MTLVNGRTVGDPVDVAYHVDGLERAKALQLPGCCIFCEEPLDTTAAPARKYLCGRAGCARSYDRAYHRDRRAGAPARNLPKGALATWHCGCGRVFRAASSFLHRHRHRCMFAVSAFPVVVVPPEVRNAA